MSKPYIGTLTKVKSDFKLWSSDQQMKACNRILIPIKSSDDPTRGKGDTLKQRIQSYADINGWDIHALFQGESCWLRSPPVCGPCAPTSQPCTDPDADDPFTDDVEKGCSNTVSIGGGCWLNGTVNYGLFGIMLRLCDEAFPGAWNPDSDSALFEALTRRSRSALTLGELLIHAYKKFGPHPEDATDPIKWVEVTYFNGPGGFVGGPGNRSGCTPACPVAVPASVNWDYVWEPVHPRDPTAPAPSR
jgi:hypothetical protein